MDEAAAGRFSHPSAPKGIDPFAGKLFVPQHNGLKPLPMEGVALGYMPETPDEPPQPCIQQQLPVGPADPALRARVGTFMAPFPGFGVPSVFWADGKEGCPNHWIVNQGRNDVAVTIPVQFPGTDVPPISITINAPPQLIGYQTTNKVRRLATVESALLNLTLNTNAVFVELYEDLVWRIAVSRGSGPRAVALDDPAAPERLLPGVCSLCMSKNLSQWSEELHYRRAVLAELWQSYGGFEYPALADPFATEYEVTLTNDGPAPKQLSFINPAKCDPARVNLAPNPTFPSALGTIEVRPATQSF